MYWRNNSGYSQKIEGLVTVDIIEEFMMQYAKDADNYNEVKTIAHKEIESALKDAGIMAITSSRVKDFDRLKEKLTKRNEEKGYKTIEDIVCDIPDFVGLRVALYFPSDKDKVHTLIEKLFNVKQIKNFPNEQRGNKIYQRRFPGYCATHYRVFLKNQLNTNLKHIRIEVQVASLLMHAWSEVEHDLVYKEKKGTVSYDEFESLDEINGLVLAGELSLQRLQRLSELRIASEKKKFENHYQLASFIYEKAESVLLTKSIYLGDVETLFQVLKQKDRLTVNKLMNDLSKVVWDNGIPVAQQLIDLYADDNLKTSKLVINNKAQKMSSENQIAIQDHIIGIFLRKWIRLERALMLSIEASGYSKKYPGGIHGAVQRAQVLPEELLKKYDILRTARNKLVHGGEIPDNKNFETYIHQMDEIINYLEAQSL